MVNRGVVVHKILERHLHPSVYYKFNKTRELKKEGVNPEEFRERGGLDEKTYKALIQRWKSQKKEIEDREQNIISKYGSLKAAPLSVGSCKKLDPVIGDKNALVLLTEFKDKKHTHEPGEIEKTLFSKGSKSLRDYYLEASWNQLDITGKVNNQWFSALNNRIDYIDEAVNLKYPKSRELVKETVIRAKNSGLNFTPFAVDGKIELLFVVCAGKGFDTTLRSEYLRPHQGQLSEPLEVQKGIVVDRYILVPELPIYDIGCYCHEVGHLLGLPDFYITESPVVGSWCVMSVGDHNDDGRTPAHPSAWCKVHLGWREPEVIKKPSEIHDIPSVTDENGNIYKIEVQGSGGREYFLLENRQQKGFDKKLPGSGLLIWHVDENRCASNPPNSDLNNLFLSLVQSDGGNELQRNIPQYIKEQGYDPKALEKLPSEEFTKLESKVKKEFTGDDGDPYPGITSNRNFDEESNPRSVSKKGTDSMVRVTFISDSDDIMKAHMGVQAQSEIGDVNKPTETGVEQVKSSTDEIARLIHKNFIDLMIKQKDKNPNEEGYEAGIQDIIEENKDLNLFKKGYRRGYRQGYIKACELLKDNE